MINKSEVQHIATLARIGLDEKEIDKLSKDLSGILNWVEKLKEVNVDGVEPTAHITGVNNISREDRVGDFENKEGIKKLFPEEKDGFDKVKSVL
ncbi:MAG: Asp-tRNA(Asn)/Glu-tRNA(Gln) amidotransferase GatCAB subunit C [Candidatus Moranbacteria bacterium CG10_big_fil_rev_8_21_14_0_10_35_21]|nr:MAG: Asp-tRNA(Asn)/Glu-tRNA(Gln) amidotransferase GatCAB subunit C [Candidatus Moranbacteria bacterium CG10_big_fil_rev_8_21_14_0_10_35_21]PJA88324.1 MAG: Asp-tRNA(Asn)/Glu-tRNA(Gln) amidotransferase GatCAB subunit C [Candidatus Moranbacteria bacterium CG_4_9_14_3_um_filter_36_9]